MQEKPNFVRLEPILEIIKTCIWTGMLSDEKPVSIMLVADQESCKTEALKHFYGSPTLAYISDLTSHGLKPYKADIISGKLRHIVLLDLVRIVSHQRSVSDRTLQSIASLMEEGESETADAGGKESWGNFPRIGIMMGITTEYFLARRGKWRQTGFMTRFIPIRFNYSSATVGEIHNGIAQGKSIPKPHPEIVPTISCQIFCKKQYAITLSQRAQELGRDMKTYGFRYQKILRALAKARARMHKRGSVNTSDVETVLKWSQFFTDKAVTL